MTKNNSNQICIRKEEVKIRRFNKSMSSIFRKYVTITVL